MFRENSSVRLTKSDSVAANRGNDFVFNAAYLDIDNVSSIFSNVTKETYVKSPFVYFYDMPNYWDTPEYFMHFNFRNFLKYALPIMAGLSFLGNTTVILVVMQKKNRNYSTSVYIASLALADLCVNCGVDLNNWLVLNGYIKETYSNLDCKLRLVIPVAGTFASVWSLVAVATERAISVLYPHKVKYICKVVSAKIIVIVLWQLSLLLALFMTNTTYFVTYESSDGYVYFKCTVYQELTEFYREYFFIFYTIILFYIPYFAIFSSTVVIIFVLVTTDVKKYSGKDMRMSVTITLLQVNFLFLLTVTPHCVYTMLDSIDFFDSKTIEYTFEAYKKLLVKLIFADTTIFIVDCNSVLNVFVYFLNSSKFRKDFITLFRLPKVMLRTKQTVTKSYSRQTEERSAEGQP